MVPFFHLVIRVPHRNEYTEVKIEELGISPSVPVACKNTEFILFSYNAYLVVGGPKSFFLSRIFEINK